MAAKLRCNFLTPFKLQQMRIYYTPIRSYQNDDNYPYFGSPASPNALPEIPSGKVSSTCSTAHNALTYSVESIASKHV